MTVLPTFLCPSPLPLRQINNISSPFKFRSQPNCTLSNFPPTPNLSQGAWQGYMKNLGVWSGKRALCNSRARVLVDLPTRVSAELFRDPIAEDEFVLWRTAVRTADGIDEVDDEWSRAELKQFAALANDGCFSVGADAFIGDPITVDQCVLDEWRGAYIRVRSTHALNADGIISGVVASRERLHGAQKEFVEPAAWRSPNLLLDYIVGLWEGRGISVDPTTGERHLITSRLKLNQEIGGPLSESSIWSIAGGGPSRVFDAQGNVDENLILYEEANVQTFLLPGGVSVSAPIRIRKGRPFSLETAFLMRPDCRKRVVRMYNRDCEWINTVFINERRVG